MRISKSCCVLDKLFGFDEKCSFRMAAAYLELAAADLIDVALFLLLVVLVDDHIL